MSKQSKIIIGILVGVIIAMAAFIIVRAVIDRKKSDETQSGTAAVFDPSSSSSQSVVIEPPEDSGGQSSALPYADDEEQEIPLTPREKNQKLRALRYYETEEDRERAEEALYNLGPGPEVFEYSGNPTYAFQADENYYEGPGYIGCNSTFFTAGYRYLLDTLEIEPDDFVTYIMNPIMERLLLNPYAVTVSINVDMQSYPVIDYENKTVSFFYSMKSYQFDTRMTYYHIITSLDKEYAVITNHPIEDYKDLPEEERFYYTWRDMVRETSPEYTEEELEGVNVAVMNRLRCHDGRYLSPSDLTDPRQEYYDQ